MKYTRAEHKRFLDLELKAIAEKYCETLNTSASVLKDNNEIYATMFVRISNEDKNGGQLLLRFKKTNGIPRKNEYFTAVILPMEICKPKTWEDQSWGDLRKKQIEFSEVHCVWQGKEDENGLLICGFKGLTLEMSDYLKAHPNCVVILGPQEPPIAYYQNLIELLEISTDTRLNSILDFDVKSDIWHPKPIHKDFTSDDLFTALDNSHQIIVQGPPGTGKTHRIAEVATKLLQLGKSVMITALTNRALMEVAEKKSLLQALAQGKVSKTALTSDEHSQIPDLVKVDSGRIPSVKGNLVLATFYISSSWAKQSMYEPPFDYVIMDEASQALYAMIGAAARLGKTIMWIGDQNQLPPVINLSEDTVLKYEFDLLSNGFKTLCNNISCESFILSDTFRLQNHAAKLTSLFYQTPLTSCYSSEQQKSKCTYSLPNGESVAYIPMEFKPGDKYIDSQTDSILSILHEIQLKSPDTKFAILSKFRATVRSLQKAALYRFGPEDSILIDTVERVQGLTTDVCIFVIPNYMRNMSLNKELFNVATSRATHATIIIGPKDILTTNCSDAVYKYLSSLIQHEEPSFQLDIVSEKQTHDYLPGVKIVGHVDLSKFERKRVEIQPEKKNYYIIDTNVFINCPDILSKIDAKYPVILSAKVIDELDKFKIRSEQEKKNAETALRLLNRETSREIKFETADAFLLPPDYDKRSPDNLILSVALKYKTDNPIMLTSDNGLQLKCKALGITTISLKSFLKKR